MPVKLKACNFKASLAAPFKINEYYVYPMKTKQPYNTKNVSPDIYG